ncbi:MAG: hypothetical protein R3B94_09340 [Hyphomonas sp.]
MDAKRTRLAFPLACIIALASCWQRPPLREEATTYPLPIAPDFSHPVVELPLEGGKAMLFGIKDCEVFRARPDSDSWDLMFKPAAYPLPQTCVRERLEFDGDFIQIEIGTQALGAGGCCTSYAAYRSRDGEIWQTRPATSITDWQEWTAPE